MGSNQGAAGAAPLTHFGTSRIAALSTQFIEHHHYEAARAHYFPLAVASSELSQLLTKLFVTRKCLECSSRATF